MSQSLSVQRREGNSKGVKNRLRNQGNIPAVIYGRSFDNVLLSVPYKKFVQFLKGGIEGSVIELDIQNENHSAIIKEIQTCIVTGKIIHIDFQKVYSDQPISKEVPIRLIGDQIARKSGVIQFQRREIEVRGLPHQIPKQIDLDITPLTAGTEISVAQIVVPNGLEIYTPKDEVVLSLVAGVSYTELETEEVSGGELT